MKYLFLKRMTISIPIVLLAIMGCSQKLEKVEYAEEWTPVPITPEQYQKAVEIIQRRAHQIAEVKWQALNPVPHKSGFFSEKTTYKGIPYSSVKELDKFVGHEVSFYTFLTAVQNPRSVLYSENVSQPPYKGINCATYYGTVCSMAVNYVLGLDAPYISEMYLQLPFMEKIELQDPYGIKIGDILRNDYYGHVVMVEEIVYSEDGSISAVRILESIGTITRIREYSLDAFVNRWEEDAWVAFRYLDFGRIIRQEEIPFLSSTAEENYSVTYSSSICTSRGDKACYREGEPVIINFLAASSGEVDLYRDEKFHSHLSSGTADLTLSNLPYGKYKVVSESGDMTLFEVLETAVTATRDSNGIQISFNSANGIPGSILICKESGGRRYIHTMSVSERQLGRVTLEPLAGDMYIKVFFRGDYGRVSNDPILIL